MTTVAPYWQRRESRSEVEANSAMDTEPEFAERQYLTRWGCTGSCDRDKDRGICDCTPDIEDSQPSQASWCAADIAIAVILVITLLAVFFPPLAYVIATGVLK